MKYVLASMTLIFVVIVGLLVWNWQQFKYGWLEELADSGRGADSAAVRKLFREGLIDACHDAATRAKLTELSAGDCELAVRNKDVLCDVKMQLTREKTIRSKQDFRSYGETYLECLYPDDTKYVTDRSLPKASDFKQ